MTYCTKCGKPLNPNASFCAGCGAASGSASSNNNEQLTSTTYQALPYADAELDNLNVSPEWKERFQLMEKIGWNDGMLKNYWNFRKLTFSERLKMSFNVLALLFGPFYYFVKGMWLKAILIILASFAVEIFVSDPLTLAAIIAGWCAGFANYDFYLLKVKRKQFY